VNHERPEADKRLPYGEGIYRRRTRLVAEPERVVANLEDDFHRFRVELLHDARAIRAVQGEAGRFPWTACPGAFRPLQAFVGAALGQSPAAASRGLNPRENCTHLFDLAVLALTHASRGGRRQYDMAVPDRVDGRTRATLHCDGELALAWEIEGSQISGPAPWSGHNLRGRDFLHWAEAELDPDTAEAALALRRSVFIANGRLGDLDRTPNAGSMLRWAANTCHSFTPGIAEEAWRVRGATLEFTHQPERLLADLEVPEELRGRCRL
jgi:hypothetical protein